LGEYSRANEEEIHMFRKLFGRRLPPPPCVVHPDDQDLVNTEDTKWWDTLSLEDLQALEKEDNVFRMAAYTKHRESDGLSAEDAARKVRLAFPFYYGNLASRGDEKTAIMEDDAKLPYVIKNRVNQSIMSNVITKEAMAESSSMNALIRKLI
jgi:hypothetical protein